ncbi:MAG: reverse transcriptase/maturase family protein [Nanoarchaeota archaeon]|nr:reverse transcriptase/maturase family protein [Nanoarchaeota archaeon]
MKTYRDLYSDLCSYDNLFIAYKKARKHKTLKQYVIEFERNLKNNLLQLRTELLLHSYRPMPLKTFVLREPKTRKISKSDFRDRVIHHAVCNIIEPILEKKFIHDSYANQKGKGTLAAIKRFEYFKRKVSRNLTTIKNTDNTKGFVMKADVKKFFDTVSHAVLTRIISRTVKDEKVLWLIRTILANHKTDADGVGMPLGNLTSQFFANVYLNELDQFVKHNLRARYYIRYVDDFVIFHRSREALEYYKEHIDLFLNERLALQIHPDKSRIFPLYRGTDFLGLKMYPHHKVIQKKNIRKFKKKLEKLCRKYDAGTASYDKVYDLLEGWYAYTKNANMHKIRRTILKQAEDKFKCEMSTKELNRHLKGQ